ncbi:hypothetical protein [Rhizocola hellebori]|nr:hypothetical protein [Rhizocola hellebori]
MRITRAGFGRLNYQPSRICWLCTTALGSAIVGAVLASIHDSYRWVS